MDSVLETPAKRRKTETGHMSRSQAYDSQDDSGDSIFNGYETIATIPVAKPSPQCRTPSELPSSPPTHITQPTQIISRGQSGLNDGGQKPSIVQVAASSPLRPPVPRSPTPVASAKPGGKLASIMAPAGTTFRLPVGVAKPPPVIDISDDEGPTYRGGSSDEEAQRDHRADIKPSTFVRSGQKTPGADNTNRHMARPSSNAMDRFKEITSGSFYKPLENTRPKAHGSSLSGSVYDSRNRDEKQTTSRFATAEKRSADVMANAYGGSNRSIKQVRQTGPAKAQAPPDMSIGDVDDYQLRSKIKRMLQILPAASVVMCKTILVARKGNFDDAMDELIAMQGQPTEIDLTLEDNDPHPSHSVAQKKGPAKQQIKAPVQSIQERWATQALSKNSQPRASSPPAGSSPSEAAPQKPRRRLVQGRRQQPSTVPTTVKESSPLPRHVPLGSDSDSAVALEPDDETELDGKVLNFFNTCSVPDLVDIAAITEEVAAVLLSQKPFRTLNEIREISSDVSSGTKRRTTKKPIGDKIVDKCLEMWTGYEAVDELVKRCEGLGRPVAEEMKKWGVDVFGATKDGELDLVSFDQLSNKSDSESSMRDSGIGTPTSVTVSADEDEEGVIKKPFNDISGQSKQRFSPQPSIMAEGVVLKDYQIVGVNWLSLLFDKKLSCILADDMGLGKTCQVIAFLANILEKGVKGPHLVVVPGSTLENWLREFSVFCPKLSVTPYYAGQKERFGVREQIQDSIGDLNVIVTTYNMAKQKDDNRFLRSLKPIVCVYDEGHILKNSKSAGYDQLMRIPAQFRLLLTGTPLQNNLGELASLLGFILPSVFNEHNEELEYIFSHKAKTTNDSHAALLSIQRINRARSMMTPFVLRRKKHQVLKHLPTKTRRVEYCELFESQSEIYESERKKALQVIEDRTAKKTGIKDTSNIMMALRKASIHPLLFRRLYTDKILAKMSKACLKEDEFHDRNIDLVYEDMTVMTDFELHAFCERYPKTMTPFLLQNDEWMDSGKVSKLCSLLTAFKENGDRALVFSQFTMVMNILEAVLETLGIRFFRLDGQTRIDERQDMIDQFYEDPDITVFLLSTKAGGAGINLACANKVVIFDSSFNPQDDIQAENRAHRVGQTREVEVVRLVTTGTIEEQIHALGETKLALDDRVAGEVTDEVDDNRAEKMGAKKVEAMMFEKIMEEKGGVVKE